jgi:ubiquitin carboxyl-terminal hydrolase 34
MKTSVSVLHSLYPYSDLAEKLFDNYLFPNLSEESDSLIVPQIPVMHTQTRQELYGILSLLCKYSEDYCTVVDCVKELIPTGTNFLFLAHAVWPL